MASREEISDLENRFYNALVPGMPQIKVAMLISRAFRGHDIAADAMVNAALDRLAMRSDIKTHGMIRKWRHAEIERLAE